MQKKMLAVVEQFHCVYSRAKNAASFFHIASWRVIIVWKYMCLSSLCVGQQPGAFIWPCFIKRKVSCLLENAIDSYVKLCNEGWNDWPLCCCERCCYILFHAIFFKTCFLFLSDPILPEMANILVHSLLQLRMWYRINMNIMKAFINMPN